MNIVGVSFVNPNFTAVAAKFIGDLVSVILQIRGVTDNGEHFGIGGFVYRVVMRSFFRDSVGDSENFEHCSIQTPSTKSPFLPRTPGLWSEGLKPPFPPYEGGQFKGLPTFCFDPFWKKVMRALRRKLKSSFKV